MVVGSSVSQNVCGKVILIHHILSLDRQCREKHLAKFYEDHTLQVLVCYIWSLDHQCRGKHVTKFS